MHVKMFLIMQVQTEERGSNPPLICIDSEPFMMSKIKRSCKLETFRKTHDLEADVYNVFVEVPSGYKHNKTSPILDVILLDEVNVRGFALMHTNQ